MNDYPVEDEMRMDEDTRLRYLQVMGVDVWYLKEPLLNKSGFALPSKQEFVNKPVIKSTSTNIDEKVVEPLCLHSKEFLNWLRMQSLKNFQVDNGSTQYISNSKTKVLVLSYPCKSEIESQQPFSGKNGVLLRAMLRSVGLDLSSVMIAELDVVNSDKQPLVRFVRNKAVCVILVLVNPESQTSQDYRKIFAKSPMQFDSESVDVYVTYHPDYLLINQSVKMQVWENIKKLKSTLST